MAAGDTLQRLARALCSDDLCDRVLEPAIADLQHDGGSLAGYAAFWRSLAWCVARDACARESRPFHIRAAVAFAITVGVIGAAEVVFLHTGFGLRQGALRVLYWVPFMRLIRWSAWLDTGTLMFGVPLAMLPTLWYSARRNPTLPSAAALGTIAVGVLMTLLSSGWIAPAVVRTESIIQRERRLVSGEGIVTYARYSRFDWGPEAEAWPELVRGAFAPPIHRFPGNPTYVALEDRGVAAYHRTVIKERLLLLALALLSGLLGWWLGARSRRRAHVIA
jgi:hypothetical protein